MESTKSQNTGLLNGRKDDTGCLFAPAAASMGDLDRTHRMLPLRMTPANMPQPMSVARGPKRLSRTENIGESAEAAILLEPKLCVR